MASSSTKRLGAVFIVLLLLTGCIYYLVLPMLQNSPKPADIQAMLTSLPEVAAVGKVEVDHRTESVIISGLKLRQGSDAATPMEFSIGRLTVSGAYSFFEKEKIARELQFSSQLPVTGSIAEVDIRVSGDLATVTLSRLAGEISVAMLQNLFPTPAMPKDIYSTALADMKMRFSADKITAEGVPTVLQQGTMQLAKKLSYENFVGTAQNGVDMTYRVRHIAYEDGLWLDASALVAALKSEDVTALRSAFLSMRAGSSHFEDYSVTVSIMGKEVEVSLGSGSVRDMTAYSCDDFLMKDFRMTDTGKPIVTIAALAVKRLTVPRAFMENPELSSGSAPDKLLALLAEHPIVIDGFTLTDLKFLKGDPFGIGSAALSVHYGAGDYRADVKVADLSLPFHMLNSDWRLLDEVYGKPLILSGTASFAGVPEQNKGVRLTGNMRLSEAVLGKADVALTGISGSPEQGLPFDKASLAFTGGKAVLTDSGLLNLLFTAAAVQMARYEGGGMNSADASQLQAEADKLRTEAARELGLKMSAMRDAGFDSSVTEALTGLLQAPGTLTLEAAPEGPVPLVQLSGKLDPGTLRLKGDYTPAGK